MSLIMTLKIYIHTLVCPERRALESAFAVYIPIFQNIKVKCTHIPHNKNYETWWKKR
jgi:hypothetical protein